MNESASKWSILAALFVVGALDAVLLRSILVATSPASLAGPLLLRLGTAGASGMLLSSCGSTLGRRATDRLALASVGALLMTFVPVTGAFGFYVALLVGKKRAKAHSSKRPSRLPILPSWEDSAWRPRAFKRAVDAQRIREILSERTPETAERRFHVLLRAKHLPLRALLPLLKMALRDPSDEVRLFAFSMIERSRDALQRTIRTFEASLARATARGARAHLHLRLAEAHWEFAYLGLAEGGVFDHMLDAALGHANSSSDLDPYSGSADFLKGRILLELRDPDASALALQRALAAGYPASKILPYLAECAFRLRDFEQVRRHLRDLRGDIPLRPVMEFWQ